MNGTLLDAAALRAAGRAPPLPFRVRLADGRELTMHRLLRLLPGKRIVGEATLGDSTVLAKLFIAKTGKRHWRQECRGIEALSAAAIPTPALRLAAPLAAGGHLVVTTYLAAAVPLADDWACLSDLAPGNSAATAVLTPALGMLARMHRQGLAQRDPHLGNFLRDGERLLVIDGDAVAVSAAPLAPDAAAANLALLLAQLPAAWDAVAPQLLAGYRAAGGVESIAADALQAALARARAGRVRDYLDKCLRDCSLFAVSRQPTRFVSVVRAERERLAPLLADLDAPMAAGTPLKSGNTCTVTRAMAGNGELVVKRYNLKSLGHALSRLWRPSRAWHSWREGHRLRLHGIATPAPLALIEERIGPLRRRAWLLNEYCPGIDLAHHLAADREPPPAEAAAIAGLFTTLARLRISHGDLKATNLLWYAGRVWLIDLDACTQHRSETSWRKAWRRDRARLLRNWPAGSMLSAWLDEALP